MAVLQRLPAVGMQTRQDLVACFPANCRTVSLPALGMRMTTASTAPSGIDRPGRPRRESDDAGKAIANCKSPWHNGKTRQEQILISAETIVEPPFVEHVHHPRQSPYTTTPRCPRLARAAPSPIRRPLPTIPRRTLLIVGHPSLGA